MSAEGNLTEALHRYIDEGGDTDTMLDIARMVAEERKEDDPE
jgi:hypothetical protein